MYDFQKEMDSWESIEYRDIEHIYGKYFIDEYEFEILKNKRDAQDDLYQYIKNSEKENNEKYGKEFVYFRDFFGVVYAIDENHNEYRLDQDGLYKVSRAIDKAPFIDLLEAKDVMSSIVKYTDHRAELGKKKNLNANEVICYEDEDDEIWGKTEDGKCWYFNQDTGEFESILKKNWPKGLTVMEDIQDNVVFQAECRMEYKIEQYALQYSNGKVSNLCEFFVDEDDKGVNAVYGLDADLNEYSLTSTSIKAVKKGTIKIDEFTHISENCLFIALSDLNDFPKE